MVASSSLGTIVQLLVVSAQFGTVFAQFGTIKIDWTGDDEFAVPSIDLERRVAVEPEDVEPTPSEDDGLSASPESVRQILARLGIGRKHGDDDAHRAALVKALRAADVPQLKALLAERRQTCIGCSERKQYVDMLLETLDEPVVARHGLSLFRIDEHLYPCLLYTSPSPRDS